MQLLEALKNSIFAGVVTGSAKKWFDDHNQTFTSLHQVEINRPYFLIDLSMALESDNEQAALELMMDGLKAAVTTYQPICNMMGDWGVRPAHIKEMCGALLDEDTMNFGYSRKIALYECKDNRDYVIEVIWHKHDGFGKSAGDVEIFVTRAHKEMVN